MGQPYPGQPYPGAGAGQPYAGQGYPLGQPQYPYPGGYGQPPKRGNNGLMIGLLVVGVVAVLAIVGVVAFAVNRGSSSDEAGSTTSTSSTSRYTGAQTPAPVVPGFRTVAAQTAGFAYDVPGTWSVGAASTFRIAGTATASDGDDYCPGSAYRTVSFVSPSSASDLGDAARTVAMSAARSGYSNSTDATASSPTSLTAKGVTGKSVQVTGSWRPSRSGCTTTTYSIYAFAFTLSNGSTQVLGIVADTGTTGELTPSVAAQILGSVRPL